MELFSNLALGWHAAISPAALFYCFAGVFVGTFVGVLPGVGALAAISLLLPITYHIEPASAIIMLAGVYYGTVYGGSTAAILLNLPGVPQAAVACLDGYPMSKQGRGGIALFLTTIASFVGAMVGLLLLVLLAPFISAIGLSFGSVEYFALMFLGLIAASAVSSGNPLKSLIMVVIGLLLGIVGIDTNSGIPRFNFGLLELMDGLSIVTIAMGLFGVSEVINSVRLLSDRPRDTNKITLRSMMPTKTDLREAIPPMFRGAGFGSFFGALPGIGGTVASFMSYAVEKRLSKHPERFGKGAVEGMSASESANNAAVQTAFIPTLTLGIPGDAVMALLMGALILHGVAPGPLLATNDPALFWGLIVSFAIGNIMLVILNIPLNGIWIWLLKIPFRILYPAIIIFICLGAYSVRNNEFDVLMVFVFGAFGYLLMILDFHPAPLLLGFIFGPLIEENLRRSLLLSRGDFMIFLEEPISAILLFISFAILVWALFGGIRSMLRSRRSKADSRMLASSENSR